MISALDGDTALGLEPQQKSIREIESGDFLAEDAIGLKGNVVLPKGTALEPGHTRLLLENRIFTVKVGDESIVNGPNLKRDAQAGELERMFAPHMENPLMAALFHAARALGDADPGGGEA